MWYAPIYSLFFHAYARRRSWLFGIGNYVLPFNNADRRVEYTRMQQQQERERVAKNRSALACIQWNLRHCSKHEWGNNIVFFSYVLQKLHTLRVATTHIYYYRLFFLFVSFPPLLWPIGANIPVLNVCEIQTFMPIFSTFHSCYAFQNIGWKVPASCPHMCLCFVPEKKPSMLVVFPAHSHHQLLLHWRVCVACKFLLHVACLCLSCRHKTCSTFKWPKNDYDSIIFVRHIVDR